MVGSHPSSQLITSTWPSFDVPGDVVLRNINNSIVDEVAFLGEYEYAVTPLACLHVVYVVYVVYDT